MSSRRSRSGGSSISTVSMRCRRSWRKTFSSASRARGTLVAQISAHVHGHRPRGAHRRHLAPLDRGEQLGLQVQRHIADLVEEQGAARRRLEAADAVFLGVGEGALAVAEQLAFEQRGGHRAQIDRQKHLVARAGSGGGFRARSVPCRCRSRPGSGRWRRSARRAPAIPSRGAWRAGRPMMSALARVCAAAASARLRLAQLRRLQPRVAHVRRRSTAWRSGGRFPTA